MTTTLVATDLDQTLIYSRRATARWGGDDGAVAAVETYQDVDSAFMTARAAAVLATLADRAVVVPVTTRTPEQYSRVRLPGGPPRYAVCANGGILLVDGVADRAWERTVHAQLPGDIAAVRAHVEGTCAPRWTKLTRAVDDLFCYAVIDRAQLPPGWLAAETEWADRRGWQVSLQGRKVYWVPQSLTKSAAVAEVARRVGADVVLAAGDSLLDIDLLEAADHAIAARHGELVGAGRCAPQIAVTDGCGLAAGEQIVDWFAAHVG